MMHALRILSIGLILGLGGLAGAEERPNVLLITADDLGWDSLGCTGNPLEGLSPNVDRLASEGLLIDHCYIATPICGPSRNAIYTGQYPQRTGYMGHGVQPPSWWKAENRPMVKESIASLLGEAGYLTGCVGKHGTNWCDFTVPTFGANEQTGMGRNPQRYFDFIRGFMERASSEGKPFYLTANTHDPHRHWARHRSETLEWINQSMGGEDWEALPNGKPYPDPGTEFDPKVSPMPPQYPDDPRLRGDLAKYYDSVHRMDQVVGEILRALEESGQADNTIVLFLSDHGMAWDMAKWSLYPSGTRTPLIVRWPGKVEAGIRNEESILSVVDIAPTLAEICGLEVMRGIDGQSFRCLLDGKVEEWGREEAFSTFNYMNNLPDIDQKVEAYRPDLYRDVDQYRPSRALSTGQFTYVWNGWSDGETRLPNTMRGEIGWLLRSDDRHRDWLKFMELRAPEELYDTVQDPGCRNNLAGSTEHREVVERFRQKLRKILVDTQDHELVSFDQSLSQ